MKLKKVINGNFTKYYAGDVLKYRHSKNSNGYEWWREYDKQGNEVHYKNSDGDEWWSDDHPDNPKNKKNKVEPELVDEKDIKAFEFERGNSKQ